MSNPDIEALLALAKRLERQRDDALALVQDLAEQLARAHADHPPAVEEKGGWEPLSRMDREEP